MVQFLIGTFVVSMRCFQEDDAGGNPGSLFPVSGVIRRFLIPAY
jgi:hypothetical protein